ncbi:MAG: Druantia anti-phage system protein DruA [Thermoanaerobaculaceae bacterium]
MTDAQLAAVNQVLQNARACNSQAGQDTLRDSHDTLGRLKTGREDCLAEAALVDVLVDLLRQGWQLRVEEGHILAHLPSTTDRAAVRRRLLVQREEQLSSPAVRKFVRGMEKSRWSATGRTSIFCLMRDGRELAGALEAAIASEKPLASVIAPYLQFVDRSTRCPFTGLLLMDVWRYFRHTWVNPYTSVPGRSLFFLVRDGAAEYHPIIGLAALSSAAVKLKARDEFIGWEPAGLLQRLQERPTDEAAIWLVSLLNDRLAEIFKSDLIADRIVEPSDLHQPRQSTIAALREEERKSRRQHHGLMSARDYKQNRPEAMDGEGWEACALTPLFRSKRAGELARLLQIKRVLAGILPDCPTATDLATLLRERTGRDAVAALAHFAKAQRVGTAIADLTVCGAIPPYSEILAGKLVAMLSLSPEVAAEYDRRYSRTPSVIASSMAGRPVVRPTHLAFLGTTSLYSERPCQYDRISIPADLVGGTRGASLRYIFIDRTIGWGTFQFGAATTKAILDFLKQGQNGLRVNYVFGEGANPKLRALREGLSTLGLNNEQLLLHGQRRLIYGAPLIENLTHYLLGIDHDPRPLADPKQGASASQAIAQWWTSRWLVKRLQKPGLFEALKAHDKVHPIRHGARVQLPPVDSDDPLSEGFDST